jgi:NAD(P)-dependent dehydrogenase (short-subunit alcohol dehydrogenase family)
MAEDFAGKIVLVTGAGRGAGRSIAWAFAELGARVAVDDLTPVHLDTLVAEIRSGGGLIESYEADISKKIPAQTLVTSILDQWDRIDILINNARVRPGSAILDMDEWEWRRMIDVNLTGAFLMTQIVGRVMRSTLGGSIVHIAAPGHIAGEPGRQTAFEAGVSGLLGLARAAAQELTPYGIRVNVVCPVDGAGESLPGGDDASDNRIRLPNVHTVKDAVLQLCADEANPLSGQIVIV